MSRAKIVLKHWQDFCANGCEYAKAGLLDDNLQRWYILLTGIHGTNDVFSGGEYLLCIHVTPNYPNEPPLWEILTPNGLFETNTTSVCISIGANHPENYKSGIGISGFVTSIVSIFCNHKLFEGNGIIQSTDAMCRVYAKRSKEYNEKNHSHIINAIMKNY